MLLTYPQRLVEALGVPRMSFAFYPSVLGGVLIGIGFVELENRASTRRR